LDQDPDGYQVHSIFDALLAQDLSYLTDFECHFSEPRSPTVDWWGRLFVRIPEARSLGLQSLPEVSSALEALVPLSVHQGSGSASTDEAIDNIDSTMTTDCSLTLLPKLSKLVLTGDDFDDLWLAGRSKFRMAMEDKQKAVYHLNHFLVARRIHANYTDKLSIELRSNWRTSGAPSYLMQEVFEAYAEFSIKGDILAPGFLLDPRNGWSCEFDLDEVEDSFMD
jgi:hypothetical protein